MGHRWRYATKANIIGRSTIANESPDTIVTSFPQRWGKPQYDDLKADDDDVLELLLMKMSSPSFTVSSVYDIALAIIEQCCNVFYNREQAQRPELQFFEFFVSAIGSVVSTFYIRNHIKPPNANRP